MPAPELLSESAPTSDVPDVTELLAAAVAAVGGTERPGQVAMAEAVAHAIASGEHVAAQAGTGTGKSLAYLVPALRHAVTAKKTVVVSTATIALQNQLVDRDLPRLAKALEPHLGVEPMFAILKGRRNYLCLHRVQTGAPEDPEDEALFDPQQLSGLGRQVKRLNEWADETTTGDRDELVPGVSEQAWRQVAVTARECLGAARCPQGTECFAERARAAAGEAHVVVTNHALLAIDALEDFQVLPEHDVVIVDEAHELVDRVTSVATGDLSGPGVEAAARRLGRLVEEAVADRLKEAGEALGVLLDDLPEGRMDVLSPGLGTTLAVVRDTAHACLTALGPEKKDNDPSDMGARKAARSALDDLHDTAGRLVDAFAAEIAARTEVVWLAKPFAQEGRPTRPPTLHVAPIGVGGLLRGTLFEDRTTVLTSATLTLGGSFDPLARQWGLPAQDAEDEKLKWSGLDVGSPFDHPKSGILYVARHLPQPGRDGLADACLTEITELVEAAGGRTLGLFSSMRAARQAADELRDHLSHPLLCQGDDTTSLLVKRFAEEERTCLFGTLSLWQGVDVPGPSLQLVIMDRIPFPRPDDPVTSARQRAVAAHGGNGFMAVAATHAALLLAQGAGRLLRSMDDRGVVAILDPRLATARYGGFLKNSLPPFWATTDPQVARGALRRLDAAAG
ncbi:helicase C-terminal domain-containing protein [Actinomadura rayongensis]|uniref:ATP-dependent helicase DinG n=1 Tax=Actinomadura rayongensis TaxID=1429076 RepID=A0A6I4WHY4_9ACTN|nr:DEAD/DEAH box helicase [Actinomadura rayongensis]